MLRLILTNAAAAALFAGLALVVSRLVRRPAPAHALWLLALVKLVTPPLVPLPLLPRWDRLHSLALAARRPCSSGSPRRRRRSRNPPVR